MSNLRMIGFAGTALLLCLSGGGRLAAQDAPGRGISGTRTFEARPGGTVTLDLRTGGSIEVEGWNRNEVQVTYRDLWNDPEDFTISFDAVRDGLEVEARYPRGARRADLRLQIRAPRRYNLRTHSAGGGITLTDLEGTFTGVTGGGSITLSNVTGSADLSTGGGPIEITDSELDGRVTTGGGSALVRDVTGDVRVTSGGGNVQYQNVRNGRGALRSPGDLCDADITPKSILISNAGGGIDLSEAPDGACVLTGGGDIDIRGGRHFVHASTGGGAIDIRTEGGDVVASTGAGDIEVTVGSGAGGGDISLGTGQGDVTLIVPSGFSASYDLTIGYTRNSRRDFRIISDVDLREERTDQWDSSWGSPRKFIRGSGRSGDGAYHIRIRTTNGNIIIREH